MECPKCHFDHPQQTSECLKCGIVFAKFLQFQEAVAAVKDVTPQRSAVDIEVDRRRAHTEFLCRVFAVPAALAFGWVVAWGFPSLAAFLSMWCHESGHAVSAWFCGFPAFPTAWFTIIGDRTRWISVVLGLAAGLGGYVAYRRERWFWAVLSAIVVVLFVAGNLQTDFQSRKIFTFWGDGGAFVLSTIMMLTMYARPDSAIAKGQVRWGLLILGAIAFWSVYTRWSGGFESIANALEDTDERGPSDIMQLTTLYGWSIYTLIHTYWRLGYLCLFTQAVAYAAGLWQAKSAETELASEGTKKSTAAG